MSNYSTDPPSAIRVWKHRIMKQVWAAVLLASATIASWSQSSAPVIETTAPDLDTTLQSIERAQQQNPAQLRPWHRSYRPPSAALSYLLDSQIETPPQKSSQSRAVGVSYARGNFFDAGAAGS